MPLNAESGSPTEMNKAAISRTFGRAAENYESYATLQRITGDRLLHYAPLPDSGCLLDAGCGPGSYSRFFSQRGYQVIAMDISSGMLATARQRDSMTAYLQADIDALPFQNASFDIVWSNLAVQWCSSLSGALQQLNSVLKARGSLRFSTVAAGSLSEVELAWLGIDGSRHINRFLYEEQIRQCAARFEIPCVSEQVVLYFPTVRAALWSLKGVGAGYLHQRDNSLPLTRKRLALLEAHWPKEEQGYRLSYQIVYGVKG